MSAGKSGVLTSLLCLVFLLTGCSLWSSDSKTEGSAHKPSTVRLTLLAEPDINPNEKGEPTPSEIAVVYLSEDSKLLSADYDQLSSDKLKKTLSKNYLDHQEYTLLPNQYKPLPPIELDKKNNYLGVIAYYADANRHEWKKIIKINGVGYQYAVLIHIKTDEIDLKKEEE